MTDLPDTDDGGYTCSKCDLPVAKINGVWQHAEMADAIACGLLSGNPLAWASIAARDE
jgi:CHASE2 domain-containing sensor protein